MGKGRGCGRGSVQCGRLNDVFKFWLMWKQRVSVCGGEGRGNVQSGRLNDV